VRKLKLQMQLSVDGYVGGPNGDLDWRTWDWDDKLKEFAYPLRDVCDTILLGRKMAEVFIPHFEDTATNLTANNGDKELDEKFVYANRMVERDYTKRSQAGLYTQKSHQNGGLVFT
jgi:dihydrofolate reductase